MSTSTLVTGSYAKSGGRSWRKSLFRRRLGRTDLFLITKVEYRTSPWHVGQVFPQHEHLRWGHFGTPTPREPWPL